MAKDHTTVIGWASDHWFLTFLLASSAISIPVYALSAAQAAVSPAALPATRVAGLKRLPKGARGTTPFPGSF